MCPRLAASTAWLGMRSSCPASLWRTGATSLRRWPLFQGTTKAVRPCRKICWISFWPRKLPKCAVYGASAGVCALRFSLAPGVPSSAATFSTASAGRGRAPVASFNRFQHGFSHIFAERLCRRGITPTSGRKCSVPMPFRALKKKGDFQP